MSESLDDLRAVFAEVFSNPPSAVSARVWAQVYGDEYPAEVEPYSYVSRSELDLFVAELAVGPGLTLVDVGSGHGGPGLWVCARTGADLVGVDISEPALVASGERAAGLGLADRASYRLGSFESLPLDDGEADAVMSIDAFLFAPDKVNAAIELARVLRAGGRLVLTSWDYRSQPDNRPPQVDDHRPILEDAGFQVRRYDETDRWQERMRAIDSLLLDHVEELAAEDGSSVEETREGILDMDRTIDHMIRRVLIVAEKG
jgi:SAM-dependent methyltransferase